MNFSEVKELLSAGFTHDEIMSFAQNPQNNPQETEPAGTLADAVSGMEQASNDFFDAVSDMGLTVNQDPPEPENKAVIPEPVQKEPEPDRMNALNDSIQKLIRTIQASNLQNNTRDSIKVESLESQVDNIMKSIVRPETEGYKNER